MRFLGLDIGERRIGVAVSDPTGAVATPLSVLDASTAARDVARLVEDYEVGVVVVGLPRSLAGDEGPQASRIRTVATRLLGPLNVPVEFVDERLSSAEAGRRMREAGASERRQRGAKDMVAASIVLQAYLDGARSDAAGADRA